MDHVCLLLFLQDKISMVLDCHTFLYVVSSHTIIQLKRCLHLVVNVFTMCAINYYNSINAQAWHSNFQFHKKIFFVQFLILLIRIIKLKYTFPGIRYIIAFPTENGGKKLYCNIY